MFMNQQDYISIGTDGLAVIFTGIQTDKLFQLIALGLTILSVLFGIVLKVVSLVKESKSEEPLSEQEKDQKIKDLIKDNEKLQTSLSQIESVVGRANTSTDKKGA